MRDRVENGKVAVGIDLGGTKILGRVVDPEHPHEVLGETRVATPTATDAVVDAIAEVAKNLTKSAVHETGAAVVAVGLGAAGLVDRSGVMRFAPNVPGLNGVDLRTKLDASIGSAVVVENDANTATWAEYRCGVAAGVGSMVMVTLGTGIGGGVIVDGVLQRGASGLGAEVGHMVINPVGPMCPCGRRGCWERFASGSGLGRLAREAVAAGRADYVLSLAGGDLKAVSGEHVTAAAADGDRVAMELMRQFAWWTACGLANLVNIFDPEMVVIGGGLATVGDLLLEPVRAAFAGMAVGAGKRPKTQIELAQLGPAAGAIGAALLAADAYA